jgi:hypothetical protein
MHAQPYGQWDGHYVDANGVLDFVRGCASRVRATRIEIERRIVEGCPGGAVDARLRITVLGTADRDIIAEQMCIDAQKDRLSKLTRDEQDTGSAGRRVKRLEPRAGCLTGCNQA